MALLVDSLLVGVGIHYNKWYVFSICSFTAHPWMYKSLNVTNILVKAALTTQWLLLQWGLVSKLVVWAQPPQWGKELGKCTHRWMMNDEKNKQLNKCLKKDRQQQKEERSREEDRREWGNQTEHYQSLSTVLLPSLRHYLRAQSQKHHTINHLQQRGAERGSTKWFLLKGQERAIVN